MVSIFGLEEVGETSLCNRLNTYLADTWQKGTEYPHCANQESIKVENYSKTNCKGLRGMSQGFQIYFA